MRRLRRALGCCACILPLGGCFFLHMIANITPGPRLQNQYGHDVEYEIERTDGSSKTGVLPPCVRMSFFPSHGSLSPNWQRAVFVNRLTIRKDGVEIARLSRDDIEGASQGMRFSDRYLALDETGLRSLGFVDDVKGPALGCSLILNTLAEDLQVRVVYRDGSDARRTWRACEPFVWSGRDIGRRDRARRGGLVRLIVTRGGEVLHDFDRREFRDHVAKQRAGLLLVTESGFERSYWKRKVAYKFVPLGTDYRRHCTSPP